MPPELSELISILDLDPVGEDIFHGHTPHAATGRIYGGQVIAQALAAAYRTVDDRVCHSLHTYFIRGGDPRIPITLKVERVRDGGSFTMRRVVALQHDKQIFNFSASFQALEEGSQHQAPMPAVPAPEGLMDTDELRDAAGETARGRMWPVEVRPVDPLPPGKPPAMAPVQTVWFRARGTLGDDPVTHQCALAYATDMTLCDTALRPHAIDWNAGKLQLASLDHVLWFHHPSDFTGWHLYVQDSPAASGGRGLSRGAIYDAEGRLVASAAQEALMRQR